MELRLSSIMTKEQFFILFFTFNQIISGSSAQNASKTVSGQYFLQLELFNELIFNYRTYRCNYSCWNIVTKNLCEVEGLINQNSCEITSCAWLGRVEACASTRNHHKFQWISVIRKRQWYHYGDIDKRCRIEEGSIYYGIYGRSPNEYSFCNCHCLKRKWKVYLGKLTSKGGNNSVIVNVRFNIKDEILYLQPAGGELGDNGRISDVSWIPLPDNPEAIRNVDLDSRIFFLNDVRLPPDHVLTGVKFEFMESLIPESINGFSIAISGVPFDFKTGKLDLLLPNRKIVRTSQRIHRERLVFVRKNPNDEHSRLIYKRTPSQYNYVILEKSKMKFDFGQSTLPVFFNDSNEITEYSALLGIGISHYGSRKNSGFFAIELFPIELK